MKKHAGWDKTSNHTVAIFQVPGILNCISALSFKHWAYSICKTCKHNWMPGSPVLLANSDNDNHTYKLPSKPVTLEHCIWLRWRTKDNDNNTMLPLTQLDLNVLVHIMREILTVACTLRWTDQAMHMHIVPIRFTSITTHAGSPVERFHAA